MTSPAHTLLEDLVYARLVFFDNVKKVFQYCAHCVPVMGTAVKKVEIRPNFQAVVCSIPCNDTSNMPNLSPSSRTTLTASLDIDFGQKF